MADEESPKIIIDEDWKSQVEREREQASEAPDAADATEATEAVDTVDAAPSEGARQEATPFDALVVYVGTHAMAAMGAFAEPDAESVPVNLVMAKLLIDGLVVVREKTQGNLDTVEEGNLARMIAELQQMFVTCSQLVQEARLNPGNVKP